MAANCLNYSNLMSYGGDKLAHRLPVAGKLPFAATESSNAEETESFRLRRVKQDEQHRARTGPGRFPASHGGLSAGGTRRITPFVLIAVLALTTEVLQLSAGLLRAVRFGNSFIQLASRH